MTLYQPDEDIYKSQFPIITLIKNNIIDIINLDDIRIKLNDKKQLNAYWGIEPNVPLSLNHLIPLIKIRDLLLCDVSVTILIADVHAFLSKGDDIKIEERVAYYNFIIMLLLKIIGNNLDYTKIIDINNVKIIRGKDKQLDKRYMLDLLKASSFIDVVTARKTSTNKKRHNNPKVSHLLYPIMQMLDETILDADIQIGNINQRKIFELSYNNVEKLGYNKCSYLIYDSIDIDISFLDDEKTINTKINFIPCEEKELMENSTCLKLLKYIVCPINYNTHYFNTIYKRWLEGSITIQKLKEILMTNINNIIKPIREELLKNDLYDKAYN